MLGLSDTLLPYFNPRPPWGGRRYLRPRTAKAKPFQSTPSVGRATGYKPVSNLINGISIHALRGEGDGLVRYCLALERHFNPRPPWGGRPSRHTIFLPCFATFQSTPSVGRATAAGKAPIPADYNISIHALRGEGDDGHRRRYSAYRGISIHALRGEGDCAW